MYPDAIFLLCTVSASSRSQQTLTLSETVTLLLEFDSVGTFSPCSLSNLMLELIFFRSLSHSISLSFTRLFHCSRLIVSVCLVRALPTSIRIDWKCTTLSLGLDSIILSRAVSICSLYLYQIMCLSNSSPYDLSTQLPV